jgi:hypothetical protein
MNRKMETLYGTYCVNQLEKNRDRNQSYSNVLISNVFMVLAKYGTPYRSRNNTMQSHLSHHAASTVNINFLGTS